MTAVVPRGQSPNSLALMVNEAAKRLAEATTSAQILDARDNAHAIYVAAKEIENFNRKRKAHDDVLAACRRAAGDALDIEAAAKRRIADEYDAAQKRGDVAKHSPGRPKIVPAGNDLPTAADLGFKRKEIHEARGLRDAEKTQPGVTRKAIDAALAAGKMPTHANISSATKAVNGKSTKTKTRAEPQKRADARGEVRQRMAAGDANPNTNAVARTTGVSTSVVEDAKALERAFADGENIGFEKGLQAAEINPDILGKTFKAKYETMLKRYEAMFNERVRQRVSQHWRDLFPKLREKLDRADAVLNRRGGQPFTVEEYNKLMFALHPDQSTAENREIAFNMLRQKRHLLRPAERPDEKLAYDFEQFSEALRRGQAEWEAKQQRRR